MSIVLTSALVPGSGFCMSNAYLNLKHIGSRLSMTMWFPFEASWSHCMSDCLGVQRLHPNPHPQPPKRNRAIWLLYRIKVMREKPDVKFKDPNSCSKRAISLNIKCLVPPVVSFENVYSILRKSRPRPRPFRNTFASCGFQKKTYMN